MVTNNPKYIFSLLLHFVLVLNALVRKLSDIQYLSLTKPTMQQCFHPSAKYLLCRYIIPSFVEHSFRVEGESWYLFANSPLCILI